MQFLSKIAITFRDHIMKKLRRMTVCANSIKGARVCGPMFTVPAVA